MRSDEMERSVLDMGYVSETLVRSRGWTVAFALSVTLILLLISALERFGRWFVMFRKARKIPGPFDMVPLVWNVAVHASLLKSAPKLDYNVGVFNVCQGLYQAYRSKKVFKSYLGFTPFIMLSTPAATEKILMHPNNLRKSVLYDMLHQWMGEGLLTSTGQKWKSRRKLITPSFHFRILEDFLPIMNENAKIFTNKLNAQVNEDFIDIVPKVQLCALSIICETAMGVNINAQDNAEMPYVQAVYKAAGCHMYRVTRPWLWYDTIFNLTSTGRLFNNSLRKMHEFTRQVIKQRKEDVLSGKIDLDTLMSDDAEKKSKHRKVFLDIMLHHHLKDPNITVEDIREEVDTFMFAGHDTTAIGVCFSLYLLGLYKDVQRRAQDELDLIYGDDKERMPTMEDIKNMKYLERVIKESQRLYPSAPIIARKIDQEIEVEGYTIPKDSAVNLFLYGLHRDPKTFPRPEEFDPDRFLPQNSLGRHPFGYVPFAGGYRNCIGQKFAMIEEKAILSAVLRRFNLHSLDKRDELQLAVEVILRPKQGLRIKFTPRP